MSVREELQSTTFVKAATEALEDLGSLLQLELQLAKAEVTDALTGRFKAIIYFLVAGIISLVALGLLSASAVLALIEHGIRPALAALSIAMTALILAGIAIAVARAQLAKSPVPHRTLQNLKRDATVVREQFK